MDYGKNGLVKMSLKGAKYTKGVADRSGGMTYRIAKRASGRK